jgi:hypothetical protein
MVAFIYNICCCQKKKTCKAYRLEACRPRDETAAFQTRPIPTMQHLKLISSHLGNDGYYSSSVYKRALLWVVWGDIYIHLMMCCLLVGCIHWFPLLLLVWNELSVVVLSPWLYINNSKRNPYTLPWEEAIFLVEVFGTQYLRLTFGMKKCLYQQKDTVI